MTQKNPKVLLVDDEEDVVRLADKRIRSGGFDVTISSEAKNVLQTIRELKPDVLLLDIWLPGVSGIEIFQKIKKNNDLAHLPVIFFSADPSQEEYCLSKLHANGFIKKPYDADELLTMIRSVLRSKSA